ncbi:MAG: septal ring lytic transglycosylase RlpA family protein [Litorivicinus sp.]
MKLLGAIALALVLSGCSAISGLPIGSAPSIDPSRDGPPLNPIDVTNKPLPVPKNEPRIKRGNVSPYTVFGVTYQVMPTAQGYNEIGTASWYGRKFHGRLTSSGEVYDMFEFTAAHKSLPIPSYVQATNLANNRTVVVRVNDRGPFAPGRIIDMSWAAAERLGFTGTGTARVELKVLAHPDAVESMPMASDSALQIVALSNAQRAQQKLSRALAQLGWNQQQGEVQAFKRGDTTLYRVLLRPSDAAQRSAAIQTFPDAKDFSE